MIVRKRKNRTWVYLDPGSDVETEIVSALRTRVSPAEHRVFHWLHENCCHGWRVDANYRHLPNDDHDYIVVRFADRVDALMFQLTFQAQAPRVDPVLPDWRHWSAERQMEKLAPTFPKTNRAYGYRTRQAKRGRLAGREVTYWYSTQRNAEGFFLGWRSIDGLVDDSSYIARRKKRDVIAWAQKRAER